MLAGTPLIVLREGTGRAEGVDARKEIIAAARGIADSLRSTLGPRGLDKMLVDSRGDMVITNDGATILQQMEIQHPAGKMLVEVAKTQDQECGDGTKTAVLLTGELLKGAEELLADKLHPTVIVRGYQIASQKALEHLETLGRPIRRTDDDLLRKVAKTAMISKGVASSAEFLAGLAVHAVTEVIDERDGALRFDKKNIQIVTRQGGELPDSEVIEGHIVEKEGAHPEMPKSVIDARIALLEGALETKKTEFSAEIRITRAGQMQAFQDAESQALLGMVDALARAGANVVFVEKGIDDLAAEHLAKAGIYAIARAKRADLELLARSTGARIVVRPVDLGPDDLGRAGRVEVRKIGDDHLTFVTGCPRARAVTLLVRGGAQHVIDEGERSLIDAISTVGVALEDGQVVTGAGATAVELAAHLKDVASGIGGREQMAVFAFAAALEAIPMILAANAGMDPTDSLLQLRNRHRSGERNAGVDALAGRVGDMSTIAVEPLRVDRQEILVATEATTMLLRVDDIFSSHKAPGPSATPGGVPPGGSGFD